MKLLFSRRLHRNIIILLVVIIIILITLSISLTGLTLFNLCSLSCSSKCEFQCISNVQVDNERFTFPEINETEVRLGQEEIVGYRSYVHQQEFDKENPLLSFFQPGLSYNERQIMLELFQTFIRACGKFRLSFFLYGGTLLGSLRHHDIIPWDDDIDVIMNTSDKSSLRRALLSTGDQFDLYDPDNDWWKFFWVKSNTIPSKPFRWPYIDIFFFSENDTHIFDESPTYKLSYSFPKRHVFPLSYHPFAGAMLPVPCNIQTVVNHNYSPRLCTSPTFSHKFEVQQMSSKTVPCNRLQKLYSFVNRRVLGEMVHEDLTIGSKLIKTVILSNKCS